MTTFKFKLHSIRFAFLQNERDIFSKNVKFSFISKPTRGLSEFLKFQEYTIP